MSGDSKPTGGVGGAPAHRFDEIVEVMRRLLAPGGCPWDREQTLDSLQPYLVEETAEVLDAMDHGTPADHCEELGDLLMQIVFQAELRATEGEFTIDDVCGGIAEKLIRRHPHVFADASADTPDEVLVQWEAIKAREKGATASDGPARALAGVPAALPPLARAQKISRRAAKVGFDWPDVAGCRAKVDEELAELDQAVAGGDTAAVEEELGDLLYAIVSLTRKLECDADRALRRAVHKFQARFERLEDRLADRGKSPKESDLEEMDALWNEVKAGS